MPSRPRRAASDRPGVAAPHRLRATRAARSRRLLTRPLEGLPHGSQVFRQGGEADLLPPPVHVRLVLNRGGLVLPIDQLELRAVDLLLVLAHANAVGEVGQLLPRRLPLLDRLAQQEEA